MSLSPPSPAAVAPQREAGTLGAPQIFLFAAAVGVIVTNLFAAQTLVGLIGPSLGFGPAAASLVATAPLLGYAAGLFLLVPLADLVENRRLVLRLLAAAVIAAGAAALSPNALALLCALGALGAACSAIQVLVPIAAALAPPERRGRVIGDVMSGLMVGILLARPSASALAQAFGWRSFYACSAMLMAASCFVLAWALPRHRPVGGIRYGALIASLWHLLVQEPVLRWRALTAALSMACFSLFWTAVAPLLAKAPLGLSQGGIAAFALVGAGAVFSTPLAGRAGDRGYTRGGTIAAHVAIIAGFGLAALAMSLAQDSAGIALALLGAGAIVLDVGVTGDQTLGRRAVNLLQPEARGRLNGLFVGLFFLGGAAGSALAGPAWAAGGWPLVCLAGALLGIAALIAGRPWRAP